MTDAELQEIRDRAMDPYEDVPGQIQADILDHLAEIERLKANNEILLQASLACPCYECGEYAENIGAYSLT